MVAMSKIHTILDMPQSSSSPVKKLHPNLLEDGGNQKLSKKIIHQPIGLDIGLQYVFKVLKLVGSTSLTRSPSGRYNFQWTLATFWSLLMTTGFTVTWLIFIFYVPLGIPIFPDIPFAYLNDDIDQALTSDLSLAGKKVDPILQAMTIMFGLYASFQLLTVLWGWVGLDDFAHFLNTWKRVQKEFCHAFPCRQKLSDSTTSEDDESPQKHDKALTRFHLKIAFCTVLPAVGTVPIFLSGVQTTGNFGYAVGLYVVMIFHFMFVELLEDAKCILIFMGIADAFYQIRRGIEETSAWEILNVTNVQGWRHLICGVRNQTELATKYLQPSQLSSILNTVLTGTVMVYLSLNLPWKSPMGFRVAGLAVTCCVMFWWRIFTKTGMAEKITREEAAIARHMQMIDQTQLDLPTVTQLQMIQEMICQNPTEIRFGNYVILNKSLLVRVMTQIITYLIVLTQFFATN